MLKKKARVGAATLALVLGLLNLLTGCESLKKVPEDQNAGQISAQAEDQTEVQTQTEPQTQSETQSETQAETITETATQKNVAYTSQDKSIRITLPDSSWKVTQDVDEMRVFSTGSSGSSAMISIVHASGASAMKNNVSVASSEEELTENLTRQYAQDNVFEVQMFEALSSDTINTYEYVVKYNSASMWAYSITYGILAENEAYVVTGTVTEDDSLLLESVQTAVESFTVLDNEAFQAMPGETSAAAQEKAEEQEESETESETEQEAEAEEADAVVGTSAMQELLTLNAYESSTTLYANDIVNVRQAPSTESSSSVIDSLSKGTRVTVTGETSNWFQVKVNGHTGYVRKDFLVSSLDSVSQTTQSETTQSETSAASELSTYWDYGTSYTYYTTTGVNLRSQPSTDSDKVGGFSSGQAVSVIGETDNWYVVYVDGVTGYVAKSYITTQAPETSAQTEPSGSNTGTNTAPGTATDPGTGTNTNTENPDSNTTNNEDPGTTNTYEYGTVSGMITDATMNTITIDADDGNIYTIDYSEAIVDIADGLYGGQYVSVGVDYAQTLDDGSLYAMSIIGY